MTTKVIEPPETEPISLEEAKLFLRVTHNAEDDLIETYITAAREIAERYQSRSFATQTLKQVESCFKNELRLTLPPVTEVTHVEYVDPDYNVIELGDENYYVDMDSVPPRIYFLEQPTTAKVGNAVQITYTAGEETIDSRTRAGILMMINHLYSRREPVVTGTIATQVPMTVCWLWDQGIHSHYGNI